MDSARSIRALTASTLAFTVCFAVWMMYGVLVTWLVDNRVYAFDQSEMGWLIGIPVLTGSILRLPIGVLTDRYGGRKVFTLLMVASAPFAWAVSVADGFWAFLFAGLGFGLSGASFAVGIAYVSLWFPRSRQGTALGVFGVGNAGAAITSLGAPLLLRALTDGGADLDAWRLLPTIYACALLLTAAVFWVTTTERRDESSQHKTLRERLVPLRSVRVWRFGLYYFLVFGGFVALAQWLIPYYVNVYAVSVAMAGMLAAIFTLPSGLIRALGGWMSDRFGARAVMYWVLGGCTIGALLLVVPRMDVYAAGEGVMARTSGTVGAVGEGGVVVGAVDHALRAPSSAPTPTDGTLLLPTGAFWHEPVVRPGDQVVKKQLIARGVTHIHFQANIWIFTAIVFVVGILMGIGKAAVYKHIPEYFPHEVGVVGGIVGVLGGLGGFVCPILFGGMLRMSGIWTTCWVFLFALSAGALVWMHGVVRQMERGRAPAHPSRIDVALAKENLA